MREKLRVEGLFEKKTAEQNGRRKVAAGKKDGMALLPISELILKETL